MQLGFHVAVAVASIQPLAELPYAWVALKKKKKKRESEQAKYMPQHQWILKTVEEIQTQRNTHSIYNIHKETKAVIKPKCDRPLSGEVERYFQDRESSRQGSSECWQHLGFFQITVSWGNSSLLIYLYIMFYVPPVCMYFTRTHAHTRTRARTHTHTIEGELPGGLVVRTQSFTAATWV